MRHAEAKGFRSPQWIEQGDQYSGTPHPYPVLMWLIDHLFPDFLAYVREGDTVVVHSLDRLGRNLDDLRRAVTDLNSRGISIEFLKEHLTFAGDDSDSSLSKLMFNMLASFAEFEVTDSGTAARGNRVGQEEGGLCGRKPALSIEQAETLRRRAAGGEKKAALARELGISRETLYQYLRA